MGEFRITQAQRELLAEGLEAERMNIPRYDIATRRRAALQMVRLGWLKEVPIGWYGQTYFCITDLGRTVASQLGLSERRT